jgi:lysozyme
MFKELRELQRALKNLGLKIEAQHLNFIIKVAQNVYVIKSGDSLYKLSEGDLQYQKLIERANPNINPSKLQVGQKIILPPKPIKSNNNMNPSQNLISLLKRYEGKPKTGEPYLIPYDDGFGNVTAGWGHNYGSGDPSQYLNLTVEKAEKLLREDVEAAAAFVRRNVSPRLTQGQFDALTSLVFNAGGQSVYKTKLFKAIDAGNFEEAESLFPTTLIGKNQGGLVQRRKEEAAMFAS